MRHTHTHTHKRFLREELSIIIGHDNDMMQPFLSYWAHDWGNVIFVIGRDATPEM